MKVLGVISATAMFLLLGATIPAFAQEERHDESAKPAAKQEQAKPQKQEQQARPAKQEQAKPEKQQQAKPQKQEQQQQQQAKSQEQNHQRQQANTPQNQEKSQSQQQANGRGQESHVQYARSGQKDSRGHEYNESHFGPNHHARFESSGGREYEGRREYSYGGYWFYAGAYPPWFYQRDVYFVMGPDGLWYAVAYDDPSLTFQVDIE